MGRFNINSDATIRNTKLGSIDPETGKPIKQLLDGDGLVLLLEPDGLHKWRFRYRFKGVPNMLSLGKFPDVGLKVARIRAQEVRQMIEDGIDPAQARKGAKEQEKRRAEAARNDYTPGTFKAVALEHHAHFTNPENKEQWCEGYAKRWLDRMTVRVFPYIGNKLVGDCTREDFKDIANRIRMEGKIDLTNRVLSDCSQVLDAAIEDELCEANPARIVSRSRKTVKHVVRKMPSFADPDKIGLLMRGIFDYRQKKIATGTALLLLMHTFQRPGNIRSAAWDEFDLEGSGKFKEYGVPGPLWVIPAAKMKRRKEGKVNGKPHIIPLAPQIVDALRMLHTVTGNRQFLFPNQTHPNRYMSGNTMNLALRALGFDSDELVGHGVRSMAQTVIGEQLEVDDNLVEAQLAHTRKGPLADTYQRAAYIAKRVKVLCQWADFLEAQRVQPLKLAA